MRGRNWLFSAFLKSFTLAGLVVQVMRRENMFAPFAESLELKGLVPRGWAPGSKGTVAPMPPRGQEQGVFSARISDAPRGPARFPHRHRRVGMETQF